VVESDEEGDDVPPVPRPGDYTQAYSFLAGDVEYKGKRRELDKADPEEDEDAPANSGDEGGDEDPDEGEEELDLDEKVASKK
jgi:hypothetical protein